MPLERTERELKSALRAGDWRMAWDKATFYMDAPRKEQFWKSIYRDSPDAFGNYWSDEFLEGDE